MELRQILAVIIGLALIVLSVAPYIKAGELTMQTPSGWEVLGSKRLKVPTRELQEIYSPDGTPTGRYGRPIDHGWFGEGKVIEIGGCTITVLDTYQDATGCHVRVRLENAEGELTTAGGQSQGVQWGDLRLYITWAKFPPEEGDWRTAKGEYFYGFEEFELTLYRVPTAPAIPLSAAGAVLGVGLVLFGVVVIREGEKRGLLPVLIGSSFLCALVVTYPGGPPPSENVPWARISWVGARGVAPSGDFSRFAVVHQYQSNFALSVYDNWGTRIGISGAYECPTNRYDYVLMSSDGSKAVWYYNTTPDPTQCVLRVFWYNGNLAWDTDAGYSRPAINYDGSKILFVGTDNHPRLVYGSSGGIIHTFSETAWESICCISDDAGRLAFRESTGYVDVYRTSDWVLLWRFSGRLLCMSRDGQLVLIRREDVSPYRLEVYRIVDASQAYLVCSTPSAESANNTTSLQAFSSDSSKVALASYDGNVVRVRIYNTSNGSLYEDYSVPVPTSFLLTYSLSPSGEKAICQIVPITQQGFGMPTYRAVGPDTWVGELSPSNSIGNPVFPFASDNEFCVGGAASVTCTGFVAGFKYRLDVFCNKNIACFSVDGGELTSSYSASHDPASKHGIAVTPPEGYTFIDFNGNFTAWDSISGNTASIYMDNNKQILVKIADLRVTGLSVSPTVVSRYGSTTVSWNPAPDASFYELQYSTTQNFSQNVITYTQITGTSFVLQSPQGGWSTNNYVRVRASTQGVYGSWTDPVEFKSVWAPSWLTVSPKNPYPLQSVDLSWEQVPADSYEVSLDGQVIATPTAPAYTISTPASGWTAGQTHTVRVRTYLQGVYSDPIENTFTPRAFPPPAYLSVLPQNPQPYEDVCLEWGEVPDASYYQLSFEGQIIVEQTTETTYTLSPPAGGWIYNKTYTVAVRAVNPSYGTSDWRENAFGTTVFPQPRWLDVSPSTPYELQSVSISWESVAQATAYDVRLDENTIASGITATNYTLTPPSGGWEKRMYTVAVRGVNPSVGGISAWTENYFQVLSFPKPSYITVEPPNPMPNENVVVWWENVEIAKFYDVALDSKTNTIASYLTETSLTLSPPEGMWSFGPHRVFVRAMDPNLGTSDWAENTFTVQVVVGLLAGPAPAPAPKPARLQLAAMVPMLPHWLVSAFNALGQIAGVYTLSLLMVLSGLTIMTLGLRRYGR